LHKILEPCQSDKMSNLLEEKTYAIFASPLNKKLIAELNDKGKKVVIFPTVTAEKLELSEVSKDKLKNLAEFDWLIFTDVYAVDFFVEALHCIEFDLFELDAIRVCALGEAVADRLRFDQIHADLIPSKLDEQSVISTISEYSIENIENLRFLVIGEINSKSFANFEHLPIYQATFTDESLKAKSAALLKGGAIDEFIFSAPEDLVSLNFLCANDELAEVLTEMQISAASESAYQSLSDHGLRPLYFHLN
jgi:uroporphyrinogen-III synthase